MATQKIFSPIMHALEITGASKNSHRRHLWIECPSYVFVHHLPSGKHTKNYGKSPFLMGKSTISMAISNSYFDITRGYVCLSSRNHQPWHTSVRCLKHSQRHSTWPLVNNGEYCNPQSPKKQEVGKILLKIETIIPCKSFWCKNNGFLHLFSLTRPLNVSNKFDYILYSLKMDYNGRGPLWKSNIKIL